MGVSVLGPQRETESRLSPEQESTNPQSNKHPTASLSSLSSNPTGNSGIFRVLVVTKDFYSES